MFANSSSIFKKLHIPRGVNVKDNDFMQRLVKLENTLMESHTIEQMPNGWRCTPKKEGVPGFIVTPETVLFVMKNLNI